MATKKPTACTSCAKAFGFLTNYKYVCYACGRYFCQSCSNQQMVLSAGDLTPPATVEAIPDTRKPQRCCNPCCERITKSRTKSPTSPAKKSETQPVKAPEPPVAPVSPKAAAQKVPEEKPSIRFNHEVTTDYSIGKKLGEGAFGVVNLASSRDDSSREYAVKIVDRTQLDQDADRGIQLEVKALEQLHHPNIVRLFAFYTQPNSYAFVLELISGGELFDRIVEKNAYSEKEARDLVLILLNALKYCHDRNIAHRDLKPENLLLTSKDDDADVKLVDFGFAIETNGNDLTEQVGTPSYVAPEIVKGEKYGKAVDMWAFGVILYILLVGYPPFYDKDQQKMLRKISRGEFEFHHEFWKKISSGAKDLITNLLTVNPAKRFTVDDALKHYWVMASDTVLQTRPLNESLTQLKKFQAAKRFKAGVKAILAANRMKKVLTLSSTASLKSVASVSVSTVDSADTSAAPASPTKAKQSNLPYTFSARYSLDKVIGEGAFAKVYGGTSHLTHEEVAIKVFSHKKMTAIQLKALSDEVNIMKELADYPHIVLCHDFFEEKDFSFLVMERIYGGELFDRIVRKQHYSELEARELARTLLNAIKYMHDRNIVHRDLKPENLLMTSESNDADVKIVDFGFATISDGCNLNKYCGTPGYMAPEILKKDNYGKPVDLWAFGVILYILICGYPPFYGHNDREMNAMVVSGRFEFHTDMWQHVSYDAKHLIAHLLLVQSRARYTVEQALEHKWIKEEDKVLEKIPLTRGQTEMRKFQIRRKLRAGFRAIHMITRMQNLSKRNAIDMLLPSPPQSIDGDDGGYGGKPSRRTSSSIPSYFDDIESTEDGVDVNNPTGVMPPAPPMV